MFLLCMEVLTTLLSNDEQNGELEGVKVCCDAPAIMNLLFVDETLILMKANERNVACLKSILDRYCSVSDNLSMWINQVFFQP